MNIVLKFLIILFQFDSAKKITLVYHMTITWFIEIHQLQKFNICVFRDSYKLMYAVKIIMNNEENHI